MNESDLMIMLRAQCVSLMTNLYNSSHFIFYSGNTDLSLSLSPSLIVLK